MSVDVSAQIQIVNLGKMSYGRALQVQQDTLDLVLKNPEASKVLIVEHDPVLTFGKNSDPKYLLFPLEFYQNQGIEIFTTERGGEVTAHMPGQLVVYPILSMTALNLSVRKYVDLLEETVIQTLKRFGIESHRDAEHPGVWVGHEKICAIGVRIKSRVSMHGLALNINNDLSLFGKIIPCGIRHRGVTNMTRQLAREVLVGEVLEELLAEFFVQLRKL